MTSWRRMYEEGLPDELPINVLPYANEEFFPVPPSAKDLEVHRTAMRDCDEMARRFGIPRRRFLQTGAAAVVTMAAINRVMGTAGGHYAFARHRSSDPKACDVDNGDLHWPGAQLNNLPGEFIMDVQTHHVDVEDDEWRSQNPGQAAFFAAVWSQSSCGEEDRLECLGRYHYMKELFLDSSTNVTALSAVPYRPDGQPLPIERAAETCDIINEMAGSRRSVMHRFVMPNRGSLGNKSDSILGNHGIYPVYMQDEFDLMTYTAENFGDHLRAWKIYCPWGDVPNTSGWWLDDPAGRRFIEHALWISHTYGIPALICAHKGFALPSFDQEKAATRDVGVVAKTYPDMHFMIYHSGYDGDGISLGGPLNQGTSTQGPYPGDIASDGTWELGAGDESRVRSIDRGVDNFIKALRENGWSARHFAPGGAPRVPLRNGDGDPNVHANVPNVSAELGSVWGSVQRDPARASFLLGKLIYYVGPRRVVWGTDSLWGGSPQNQIIAFRAFEMSDAIKLLYHLPHGLEGDIDDPLLDATDAASYTSPHPRFPDWPTDGLAHPERTIRNGILGRNAAALYRVDPDAALNAITCDQLTQLRDGEYGANPMASNDVHGPRTAAGVLEEMYRDPWYRGARKAQNEAGFLKRLR